MTRPFVFINSAMSADGKISSFEHSQVRISGQADKARVDLLRAESDAIMVGVGTVLADDPSLRVKSQSSREARRTKGWPEDPLRIIADSRARTPPSAKILGPGCIVAVTSSAPQERLDRLSSTKSEIIVCGKERVDLTELFSQLFDRGVKRLMVEGGATLNWSLLNLGLVDETLCLHGSDDHRRRECTHPGGWAGIQRALSQADPEHVCSGWTRECSSSGECQASRPDED